MSRLNKMMECQECGNAHWGKVCPVCDLAARLSIEAEAVQTMLDHKADINHKHVKHVLRVDRNGNTSPTEPWGKLARKKLAQKILRQFRGKLFEELRKIDGDHTGKTYLLKSAIRDAATEYVRSKVNSILSEILKEVA